MVVIPDQCGQNTVCTIVDICMFMYVCTSIRYGDRFNPYLHVEGAPSVSITFCATLSLTGKELFLFIVALCPFIVALFLFIVALFLCIVALFLFIVALFLFIVALCPFIVALFLCIVALFLFIVALFLFIVVLFLFIVTNACVKKLLSS